MRGRAGLIAIVGLLGVLVLTGCAPTPSTKSLPSGNAIAPLVVYTPSPTPSATFAPRTVIGKWKAVEVLGVAGEKARPAHLELIGQSTPNAKLALSTGVNGFAADGCNSSNFNAVFGPGASAHIYPGISTGVACMSPGIPLYSMYELTRSYGVGLLAGQKTLTFYDAHHATVGTFVRAAAKK